MLGLLRLCAAQALRAVANFFDRPTVTEVKVYVEHPPGFTEWLERATEGSGYTLTPPGEEDTDA